MPLCVSGVGQPVAAVQPDGPAAALRLDHRREVCQSLGRPLVACNAMPDAYWGRSRRLKDRAFVLADVAACCIVGPSLLDVPRSVRVELPSSSQCESDEGASHSEAVATLRRR